MPSPLLSRREVLTLAASAAGSLLASGAQAARNPDVSFEDIPRPKNELALVVPYAAGGPLDRSARKLAQEVKLARRVQVLNVPGEGGATGTAMVARAGARDPMLLMGAVATHAVLPWLDPQLPYDPLRDFTPLMMVARIPHVLVMRSELALQWRIYTPADLLRFMSKNRQPLRYASGGSGSIGHIAAQQFQTLTRVPLQHLPFSGARPALSALLEGSADLMFDNVASALPHIQAGRLKAIGVTSRSPLPLLPDVPSLSTVVSGMHLMTWFGLFATAGISDTQAKQWTNAFAQVLQKPEVQQYFDAMGVMREDLRLQDFARLVQSEHSYYGLFIKANRIQPG